LLYLPIELLYLFPLAFFPANVPYLMGFEFISGDYLGLALGGIVLWNKQPERPAEAKT
jgi:hypothetical protein